MTRVSSPCTVRAFCWICQPLYLVPAYSMNNLNRAMTWSVYVGVRVGISERRRIGLDPDARERIEQLVGLDGLGDMVVEAGFERALLVLAARVRGHRDRADGDSFAVRQSANRAHERVTILTRHG